MNNPSDASRPLRHANIGRFRNPAAKKEVWEDMKLVLRLLQEA